MDLSWIGLGRRVSRAWASDLEEVLSVAGRLLEHFGWVKTLVETSGVGRSTSTAETVQRSRPAFLLSRLRLPLLLG